MTAPKTPNFSHFRWMPQRTRYGLTVWTFGHPRARVFAAIRRDVDGLAVTRSMHQPLRKGAVADLYAAFDTLVTEELARFVTQLDNPATCKQCVLAARPYLDKLQQLINDFTAT